MGDKRDDERQIRFSKMQGAGNDYIYIDATQSVPSNPESLAIRMSDRHFGIGSDGLVMILPSDKADFRMRMFNSDGSEAEMCGNATRCIGKYVFEKGLTSKTILTLETKAGIKHLNLHLADEKVREVTVDMGEPILTPSQIPVRSDNPERKIAENEIVGGDEYIITGVSMGNPHAVIFVDNISDEMVLVKGPILETAEIFPRKSNIEFAKVLDRNNIEMRVWERGTGETLACGTGACATAVAAVLCGLTDREVNLHLRGGKLKIHWKPETNHVLMTGPAEFICDGEYFY